LDVIVQEMTPLLAVKNLSCVWPEGDPIFEKVSFNVNEGDIIVLQARSGSGCVASILVSAVLIITSLILVPRKTTLLKCIAHLYLYRGDVEFRGKSVAFLSSRLCLTRAPDIRTPKAYGKLAIQKVAK
jgi:ABC-type branched-subunit amino acid transport system ATPase component